MPIPAVRGCGWFLVGLGCLLLLPGLFMIFVGHWMLGGAKPIRSTSVRLASDVLSDNAGDQVPPAQGVKGSAPPFVKPSTSWLVYPWSWQERRH